MDDIQVYLRQSYVPKPAALQKERGPMLEWRPDFPGYLGHPFITMDKDKEGDLNVNMNMKQDNITLLYGN